MFYCINAHEQLYLYIHTYYIYIMNVTNLASPSTSSQRFKLAVTAGSIVPLGVAHVRERRFLDFLWGL